MASFYKARFANAADFTFFMVGAFKLDEVLPLVAKYVGSLPSTGTASAAFKQMGAAFPPKIVREQVSKGREPRAQTILSFAAEPPLEENEQSRVEATTDVLEIALRDILREELGETYGVSVGLAQPLPQRGAGRISVSFGGAPDKINAMVDRTLKEVARLQQEGPSEDLTNRAKETARRAHETAKKQNGFWLGRLQSAKLLGRDPNLILTREQRIDAINRENIHEMFKKYFPMDRYTVVTLRTRAVDTCCVQRATVPRAKDRATCFVPVPCATCHIATVRWACRTARRTARGTSTSHVARSQHVAP